MQIKLVQFKSGECTAMWDVDVDAPNAPPTDIPDLDKWRTFRKTQPIRAVQMKVGFWVTTREGPMHGLAGDWLAVGVEGELWPIKDSVFRKSYQEVR